LEGIEATEKEATGDSEAAYNLKMQVAALRQRLAIMKGET